LRACSTHERIADVVADFKSQLTSREPALLVFFASSRYALPELGPALEKALGVLAVGCSTAGEIVSGRMLNSSVVGMMFDAEDVRGAHVARVEDVGSASAVREALQACGDHFGQRVRDMDPTRYVGLVLMDGTSAAEEAIMATLSASTNVVFVGGSAGDDMAFKQTQVFAAGKTMTRGAALVLLDSARAFEVLKTQSFTVLGARLRATKVDEASRTVHEFDGQPATVAYAAALGVPVSELRAHLMKHPLGILVNGEPFVRSARVMEGTSVSFFCQIAQGAELALLEGGDIVADTTVALADKVRAMGGGTAGLINFNCVLRTLELESRKQRDAYGAVFANTPMIGFSTYGEAYVGHMNQTATMLLFK
jgi:hypothetical protein